MDLAAAQDLFDAEPGWLNTASFGLPPRPAWDALQEALAGWRHGTTGSQPWFDATQRAREAFARLVGAPAADVAIGSTTSGLLAPVAAALPAGSRVVVPDVEFTSNLFPWLVHADRGVEVVTVPVDELVQAVDRRTTVVAFSAVQSATGQVADFDRLVEVAHDAGALVVVDASQAAGWLPRDWTRADVVVASAYKWLMAPRGAAFGYFAPSVRERLRPIQAGWFAGDEVASSFYGPPLRLAPDARRFDISPAWFCYVGAAPALDLVLAVGVDRVHAHDVGLANRFREGLGLPPGDSAIVSVEVPRAEERLAAAGIRAGLRNGRVRVSFHLYSTEDDVERAVGALRPATGPGFTGSG
ncbi:Selenocysteine lyase/Cysteine desulfurase [Actinopolymorpha cephalotaxi]|uniref:Selenocysteine lyase/cysteine desulfurase n=1 Tax=Actinopolymorpha cephalotaxi TaxID=504797 RepID=A0A1I2VPH2_9ACTN|nr:aminotransferase class V-fold PLP-dependent enzyme [Actinopolymorpha cephalotaxi]NYH83222.1 selenocysteine lyase/cysteine desulfurase [Actinopolymorpha cephalotaxi]SFG91215.1 Selenocysteine lyase/Cysteine desulfurase [Actinopolymorpha cephalotaxi]